MMKVYSARKILEKIGLHRRVRVVRDKKMWYNFKSERMIAKLILLKVNASGSAYTLPNAFPLIQIRSGA